MGDKELLASIGMTENEANARAVAYETDTWDEKTLGKPRRGRPPLSTDEEVRPYTVRFPVSLMEYVDERAREHGSTRSEELRRIVADERNRAIA